MIEEDRDDALGLEAKQQGMSKAALIWRYVRQQLGSELGGDDSLSEMVGIDDFDASPIDDVVYRRSR